MCSSQSFSQWQRQSSRRPPSPCASTRTSSPVHRFQHLHPPSRLPSPLASARRFTQVLLSWGYGEWGTGPPFVGETSAACLFACVTPALNPRRQPQRQLAGSPRTAPGRAHRPQQGAGGVCRELERRCTTIPSKASVHAGGGLKAVCCATLQDEIVTFPGRSQASTCRVRRSATRSGFARSPSAPSCNAAGVVALRRL